ncbi:MAG: hypothetical protein AAF340_12565 [Pseudomonadota bacterium]
MSWFKSIWALLFGVFCVLVGLWLISSYEKLTFMQKMLFGGVTEVGFAFVIAWVVGQTFEKAAKAEYNEYIQKQEKSLSQNILMYLFDVDLTKGVFQVVSESVLSNPIVKKKQIVEYSIIEEHTGTDWITVNCFFDYTLRNISNSDVFRDIRFHFAEPRSVGELEQQALTGLGLRSLEVGGSVYEKTKFSELVDHESAGVGQNCYSVRKKIASGEDLRVRVSFCQLKRSTDKEIWTTYDTCEALEVTFRCNSANYECSIEALHPSRRFDTLSPSSPPEGILRATSSTPLLPANGFVLWWERRE